MASLSPEKWEPPTVFSPSPRGGRLARGARAAGGGGRCDLLCGSAHTVGLTTDAGGPEAPDCPTLTLLDMS